MPRFLASFNFDLRYDWVWLYSLLVVVVGIRMGYWLVAGDSRKGEGLELDLEVL
jgi:hypothetical protein